MDAPPSPRDLRLSGLPSGDGPWWPESRSETWTRAFLALGIALRLFRIARNHALWRDEAYLAANVLERDFAGLARPLAFQQVCPLGFLWAEKGIVGALGFSEWSLRLLPTLAAIAGLILFRHVAGRLLKGAALTVAVAILAIGYTPIRHGGEVKPYATDFLFALALIGLAVEWLRTPERTRFLWGLAALGPIAVFASNPAIFVAASVGAVLAIPAVKERSPRALLPLAVFVVATAATFLALLRWVNAPQSAEVMPWMQVYWAGAFPPRSPTKLLAWLLRAHTSQMFAYPAGGDRGASGLTTGLVIAAIVAHVRRGSRAVLALMLAPFALGLLAAFLDRYPYGGSARTMQYVAPAIILMAGLGAAVLLGRLSDQKWGAEAPRLVLGSLLAIGLGEMAWDATHAYPTPDDRDARAFARRFWDDESRGATLLCARSDLRLPLDRLVWQGDRASLYLCHRAIYARRPASPDRREPVRLVVFGETREDAATVSRWIADHADRYRLRGRRERTFHKGRFRGKAPAEDRYVVYDLAPTDEGLASLAR